MKPKTKPINTTNHKLVAFIASERAYKSLYQIFRLNMFYCLVFIFISMVNILALGFVKGITYNIATLWIFLIIKDFVPVYYKNYGWKVRTLITSGLTLFFMVVVPIYLLAILEAFMTY